MLQAAQLKKLDTDYYNLINLYHKSNTISIHGGEWVDANYSIQKRLLPEVRSTNNVIDADLLYVMILGYKYKDDFRILIPKIKELSPKKIIYINDDYHTFTHLNGRSNESQIIEDIIEGTRIDYTVYDPEYGSQIYYKKLDPNKIKYFNYFNDSWTNNFIWGLGGNYNFNVDRKYKICNMNRRGLGIRSMSALMTYEMKDVFTTCYHNEKISTMYIKSQNFSKENTEIALNKIDTFKQTDLRWDSTTSKIDHTQQNNSINIIKDSYVSLTNESKWQGLPFYSEKTIKCWITKTPYILLSAPGTLALLEKLGFKSFNKWWDEGYDLIEKPGKRFDSVMKIVEDIQALSFDDLKNMMIEMKPVLEHNVQQMEKLPKIL